MTFLARTGLFVVLGFAGAMVAGCGDDDAPAGMDAGVSADAGGGEGGVSSEAGPRDSGLDAGWDGAVATLDAALRDAGPPYDAGPPFDAGAEDYCTMPSDCAWGEIDHEILAPTDCICLFGCPSLPQSVATRDRRAAQYADKCTPGVDGMGNPCPVDDCITPPPLTCTSNHCVVAPDAG